METTNHFIMLKGHVARTIAFLVILTTNMPFIYGQETYHGAVQGNFAVSPTGAATYTVPIDVPPGAGGVQPQIAITYDSQSGMGLAGWGCNLAGYSAITRRPKDKFHDGVARGMRYGEDDAYYLDGKRLVLSSGTEGMPGCVYNPEGDPYTTVKLMGTYTAALDNRSYEVSTPDGLVAIYGNTSGTRQAFHCNNKDRIAAWYIHTVSDTLGNALEWQYSEDQHFVYPTRVTYGTCSVEFSYTTLGSAARPFKIMSVSGMMNKRLTEIRCKSGNEILRQYILTYNTTYDTTTIKYPRLVGINVSDGHGHSLKPLEIVWNGLESFDLTVMDKNLLSSIVDGSNYLNRQFVSADINGDGIDDIIEIGHTWKSQQNKFFVAFHRSNYSSHTGNVMHYPSRAYWVNAPVDAFWGKSNNDFNIGDFDGDGLADFVYFEYTNSSYYNMNESQFKMEYGKTVPEEGDSTFDCTIICQHSSATKSPLYSIADIDNDGRSEIIILERDYRNGYRCFISNSETGYPPFDFEDSQLYLFNSFNSPMSSPNKIFVDDFDGDGLRDLIVFCDEGYKIYWNQKGHLPYNIPFTESSSIWSSTIDDADKIAIGDFDGDGLSDFVINEYGDWNYYFAINNGDGTFNKELAANIDLTNQSTENDDNRFSLLVNDFDHDGMSDLLVAKAVYEHHEFWPFYSYDEFLHTDIRTYRSSGITLSLLTSARSGNDNDAVPGRIFVGDFDGNGINELANYGANITAFTTNSTSENGHFYHENNSIANSKIVSITDGLKNTTTINYASLSNLNIYSRGSGASYPVADICKPLHVVRSVQVPCGMSENYNSLLTEIYSYKGLKMHVSGRGILGFTEFTTVNDVMGTTTKTVSGGWTTNNRFTPTFSNMSVTISDDSVSTTHSVIGFHPVFNGLNYYLSRDTVIITDFDGNTETTEYLYDLDKGVVTKQKTYPDGNSTLMYKETESADFVKKAGQWLPRMIYTRQKHKDDPIAFESIEKRTYNSFGLPDTIAVNYGTSLALTKAYTYDHNGNVLSETISGNGLNTITTHYEYDDLTHRFVKGKYTTPSSYVLEYTHDNWGNILTETDKTNSSNPLTTTNTYDGFGNLTESVSPEGIVTNVTRTWQEGPKLYCVKEETEGKPWVCTYYDGKGRETKMETRQFNGIDFEKNYLYDERGNLAFKETKNWGSPAISEWLEYDSRGRVTKDSLYTGSTTTYTYGNRQITETKDGRSTQTRYDAWGNIKKVQDPIGYVTYAYSSNGKPSAASTGNGIVTMGYDDCGNQVCLVDPDAGTMTYTYNAAGQIISQTDARGISTTYKFDALNRTDTMTIGNTMVKYSYGTAGNASQRLTGLSTSTHGISYTYDSYGHIATETRNYGSTQYTFSHTYDYLGRLSRTVYPGNVTVDYHYDDLGYNDMMTVNGNRVWYISDYDYYANGNDLYVIDSLGTGQNGLARTIRYDDYGNLSTIVMTRQNTTLHAMTFYHDRFTGNLTSRSGMLPNDGEVFTYDPLDRLVRYQDDGSHWDNIYQYTHDGNIQYKTGIGYYDYQPTSAIRPHAVKRVENLNGKVPTGRSFVTYNDLGKASSLYDDSSPSSLQYDITYGPDGERWESSLYRSNYQWPDTVRRYVGDMEIVSSGPSEVCRFYHLGHGVILRKVNNTVTPLYAFTDNLGSIIRLYTGNGTEKFRAQYDPWGMQEVKRNDVNITRGYCGHEMLNDFQLINMNGRMYDPVLGRFLSPDNYVQMPTSAQSFNRYSYCLNNPLKYTDPSGELFGFIGGFIRGIGKLFTKGDILAPFKESWNGLKLDFKVFGGLFVGDFKQIVSRNTWEILQTSIGLFYSEMKLFFHDVEAVEYYDGATYVININKDKINGVTLGSYININDTHELPYDEHGKFAPYKDELYMHEYGHYLQSQDYGFGYLFNVGIPSLWDLSWFGHGEEREDIRGITYKKHRLKWFELDASKRGHNYFDGLFKSWNYINYPIENPH